MAKAKKVPPLKKRGRPPKDAVNGLLKGKKYRVMQKRSEYLKAKPKLASHRPTEFTPEVSQRICSIIRKGSWLETAAAVVGLTRDTLYNWLKWGNEWLKADAKGLPDGGKPQYKRYADFVLDVMEATANWEVDAVAAVEAHGGKDWRAFAWLLERKNNERYGSKKMMEVGGKVEYKHAHLHQHHLSRDEIELDELPLPLRLGILAEIEKKEALLLTDDKGDSHEIADAARISNDGTPSGRYNE